MNAWQLAEDFRAAFAADPDFEGKHFYTGQDASTFQAPALIFSVTSTAMNGSGTVAAFVLTVQVHGLSSPTGNEDDPAPDIAHAELVKAVETKLLGTGKAALLAALNALTRWNIRGWNSASADPTTEGLRFLTPILINGTVKEI